MRIAVVGAGGVGGGFGAALAKAGADVTFIARVRFSLPPTRKPSTSAAPEGSGYRPTRASGLSK
jgi:predicted dinucleotide-binding enzyme